MIYFFYPNCFILLKQKGVVEMLEKGWEKEEIKKLEKELEEIEARKKEILSEIDVLNFWVEFEKGA